ncbi:hypothetical protein GFGA_2c0065 (plasmid) [Gluconobacter frateurii NBRC 103465]|nr:hypothetical protein GFGA_2c0065 [Gluconobacter frateurii NBRC 103465]
MDDSQNGLTWKRDGAWQSRVMTMDPCTLPLRDVRAGRGMACICAPSDNRAASRHERSRGRVRTRRGERGSEEKQGQPQAVRPPQWSGRSRPAPSRARHCPVQPSAPAGKHLKREKDVFRGYCRHNSLHTHRPAGSSAPDRRRARLPDLRTGPDGVGERHHTGDDTRKRHRHVLPPSRRRAVRRLSRCQYPGHGVF